MPGQEPIQNVGEQNWKLTKWKKKLKTRKGKGKRGKEREKGQTGGVMMELSRREWLV